MTQHPHSLLLARAALLVLDAAMSGPPVPQDTRYLLLPETLFLTHAQMCERLAAMPKPVRCVSWRFREQCAVGCWSMERDAGESFVLDAMTRTLGEMAADAVSRGNYQPLVTFDADPSLTLSVESCRSWLSQYDFPLASLNIRPLEPDGPSPDVFAAIRASPSEGGYLDFSNGE